MRIVKDIVVFCLDYKQVLKRRNMTIEFFLLFISNIILVVASTWINIKWHSVLTIKVLTFLCTLITLLLSIVLILISVQKIWCCFYW